MEERISDLSFKEVIDLDTGKKLGRVRDALVDEKTGKIAALIVPGRLRWLGLLGREEEIVLPWDALERLGEDILLVHSGGGKYGVFRTNTEKGRENG